MKSYLNAILGSFVPAFQKGIFEIRFGFKRLAAQSMNNITSDIEDKLNNTSETGIINKLRIQHLNFPSK
jgi:hypothetical protein